MPETVAAAVIAATGASGAAAAAISAATYVGSALAISYASQALFGQQIDVPGPNQTQTIRRETIGARVGHYGRVRTGGQVIFDAALDGDRHIVIATGHGKQSALVQHYLNGEPVSVDGEGFVTTAPYAGNVRLLTRDGADDQTAFAELTAVFPEWTADHRCRGVSLVYMTLFGTSAEDFATVYPGSVAPEYTQLIDGRAVYDPRKDSTVTGGSGAHRVATPSTWEFSNNPVLIWAAHKIDPDGFALDPARIAWADIMAEADVCDVLETTSDDRQVPTYSCGGSFSLASPRGEVSKAILATCDGFEFQRPDGLLSMRVGRYRTPAITLTAAHVVAIEEVSGVQGPDETDGVFAVYSERNREYKETDSNIVFADPSNPTGSPQSADTVRVLWVPEHNQAMRLAKRALAELTAQRRYTITTTLAGLSLYGQRFFALTIDEMDLDAQPMEITRFEYLPGDHLCVVQCREVDPDEFAFDAETEEGDPPEPITQPDQPFALSFPEGLEAAQYTPNDSTQRMRFAIDDLADDTLHLEYQVWRRQTTGLSTTVTMVVSGEFADGVFFGVTDAIPVVGSSAGHFVRVRSVNSDGEFGAWVSTPYSNISFLAAYDGTAPASPTSLAATGTVGQASLSWTNPDDMNFQGVSIYRHTADDFSAATQIGFVFGEPEAAGAFVDRGLGAGTYYYWAVAENASGAASVETSSVSAVVS